MGNESRNRNDGIKDGAEGKIDTIRAFCDEDYARGAHKGEGIRDGKNSTTDFTGVRTFFDKDYDRGVKIGRKQHNESGRKRDYDSEDEGHSSIEEISSSRIWLFLAIVTSSLGIASLTLPGTNVFSGGWVFAFVILFCAAILMCIACWVCSFFIGGLGFVIFSSIMSLGGSIVAPEMNANMKMIDISTTQNSAAVFIFGSLIAIIISIISLTISFRR